MQKLPVAHPTREIEARQPTDGKLIAGVSMQPRGDQLLRASLGQRFFSTPRGRIVLLVRRSARTVDELTQLLGLTRNAVREHLATLERDGLVQRSGVRRGDGRPAHLYALTPEAAELFARGYAPVLGGVLDELAGQLSLEALEALLRGVGRRLASGQPVPRGGVRERLAAGVALLNELGGLAEVRESDGVLVIEGWSCPLASVVVAHSELCRVPEAMLTEIIGFPVQERCDRGEPPRCFFTLATTPEHQRPDGV